MKLFRFESKRNRLKRKNEAFLEVNEKLGTQENDEKFIIFPRILKNPKTDDYEIRFLEKIRIKKILKCKFFFYDGDNDKMKIWTSNQTKIDIGEKYLIKTKWETVDKEVKS